MNIFLPISFNMFWVLKRTVSLRSAKALTSLHIHAVSPEPWLLAYTKHGSRGRLKPKIRSLVSLNMPAPEIKGCFCVCAVSSKISCASLYVVGINTVELHRLEQAWDHDKKF